MENFEHIKIFLIEIQENVKIGKVKQCNKK